MSARPAAVFIGCPGSNQTVGTVNSHERFVPVTTRDGVYAKTIPNPGTVSVEATAIESEAMW